MVKLIFEFYGDRLKDKNLTEDEMLAEVREFAGENDIDETSHGIFEKDGEDALCLLMMIAHRLLTERPNYMECLKSLVLDDDGDIEECVEIAKKWI